MEKMDMDHDGNVGGDEFLATLIDWGQVSGQDGTSCVCLNEEHGVQRLVC
jgi:hypothetical protein